MRLTWPFSHTRGAPGFPLPSLWGSRVTAERGRSRRSAYSHRVLPPVQRAVFTDGWHQQFADLHELLIDWLSDWLIDWLTGCFQSTLFTLRLTYWIYPDAMRRPSTQITCFAWMQQCSRIKCLFMSNTGSGTADHLDLLAGACLLFQNT